MEEVNKDDETSPVPYILKLEQMTQHQFFLINEMVSLEIFKELIQVLIKAMTELSENKDPSTVQADLTIFNEVIAFFKKLELDNQVKSQQDISVASPLSIEYAPKLQELANLYSPSNIASTEAREKTKARRLSNIVSPQADQHNASV